MCGGTRRFKGVLWMGEELSSYGYTFTIVNFSEPVLELPVFQKWNMLLSMDIWSHQVYATTKRYYGKNVKKDKVCNFLQTAERIISYSFNGFFPVARSSRRANLSSRFSGIFLK